MVHQRAGPAHVLVSLCFVYIHLSSSKTAPNGLFSIRAWLKQAAPGLREPPQARPNLQPHERRSKKPIRPLDANHNATEPGPICSPGRGDHKAKATQRQSQCHRERPIAASREEIKRPRPLDANHNATEKGPLQPRKRISKRPRPLDANHNATEPPM